MELRGKHRKVTCASGCIASAVTRSARGALTHTFVWRDDRVAQLRQVAMAAAL